LIEVIVTFGFFKGINFLGGSGDFMKYNKFKKIIISAGRLFDFAHCYDVDLHNKYLNTNSKKMDNEALRSDWKKIGMDLKNAITNQPSKNKTA
jgi:hypothetical protein